MKIPDWSLKVWEVCCSGSFTNCDETEEESKEDDDDINYIQVLSLINSKFLNPKQLKIYVLYFERAYIQRRVTTKWSDAKNLSLESKYNDYYQQYLTEKNWYTYCEDKR